MTESNWNEVVQQIEYRPIRISELNQIKKEIKLSAVSFKYNLRGIETYFNGSKDVMLKQGEYLMAINQSYCEVEIKPLPEKDLGVCIDINTNQLREALGSFLQPNHLVSYSDKIHFFLMEELFCKYPSNVEFHNYMQLLFQRIKQDDYLSIQELQYDFIRKLLFHQSPYLFSYCHIPAVKQSTRSELYTRLIKAKTNLHDSIYHPISMPQLAKEVCISEYRLYHLFKSSFGISPHKYLLQLKLNEALSLRKAGEFTWTEIANKLQFANVQTFSKAFKKYFRLSPAAYQHSSEVLHGAQGDK